VRVAGKGGRKRQEQIVRDPENEREPDDCANPLVAQSGKIRARLKGLDVRWVERKCGHCDTIAHRDRPCRLPLSRTGATFDR
jgi:hypothetical protein